MKKSARQLLSTCCQMKTAMVALDLLTISFIFTAFVLIKKSADSALPLSAYFKLWPFLLLFWLVFEKTGLYGGTSNHSGASLGPVEEIRRFFYAISGIFIAAGFANFCYRPDDYLYSRIILTGTYIGLLICIPINRILFRKGCIRLGCWGVPAIVIGSGETAVQVFNNLARHPEYGLRLVGYFTNNRPNKMAGSALFLGKLDEIPEKSKSLGVRYAILAKDEPHESPEIQRIIQQYGTAFPHLLLISKSLSNISSGVALKDIGGVLGLEVQHNLQIPHIYRIKRLIDFLLTIPCLIA